MSRITDNVFAEVCLDERVSDGIFQLENANHMDALRDYFVKRGITKEAAASVTNRMIEGRFPERQAYRSEDGILVTWPSTQHMNKAFTENPGKYVKENPNPKKPDAESKPVKEPIKREPPTDSKSGDVDDEENDSLPKSSAKTTNLFDEPSAKNGDQKLEIEPVRGDEKPESKPIPAIVAATRTPERIAAEKEVTLQIMGTSNNSLSGITPPLSTECRRQLSELYKKADELGYSDAITFLTQYVGT